MPYSLLYPYASYLLASKLKRNTNRYTYLYQLLFDGLHTGIILNLIGFALIPSISGLLIIVFSTLIVGGIRQTLFMIMTILSCATATWLVMQPPIQLEMPLVVSAVSVLFAALYICVIAYYVHLQSRFLTKVQSKLEYEQEKTALLAKNLASYLSPQIWKMIFDGNCSNGSEIQHKKLTVFFSDIKDFTLLAQEVKAEALISILNLYLNDMSKIALKHNGTIDKFIGDSIMIFFGDPDTQGEKKDAIAAVSMAIAMRQHMLVLRQQWQAQGINKPLPIRMGINTGYCEVGNFGTQTRMDYTIIGSAVNLASRLENAAGSDEILISNETNALVKDIFITQDKGQIQVKGISQPVQIFQVIDYQHGFEDLARDFDHYQPRIINKLYNYNIQNQNKKRL